MVRLPEVLWHEFASVAVMVKVDVAAAVGVPEMAPVLVFRLKPAGSDPLATAYTYGETPPLATTLDEYAVPTVPVPVGVAMVMTGQIFSVMARSPVQPFASVAVTVSETPAPLLVVGVPLSTPAVLSVSPAGNVPLVNA